MKKIIPKKVEMIELFYDLIFVYAISKMAGIIHHLHHGEIGIINFLQYLAVCFIVLQIWLYQTNYINHYGKHSIAENILLYINMFATVFMARNINTDWSVTFKPFNMASIVMCITIIAQFALQLNKEKEAKSELLGFISTLAIEVVMISIGLLLGYDTGLWIVLLGAAMGILLPFVITKKHLDVERTNFPHLVERMGLIVIITFGEMIINIVSLFDINLFGIIPILVFSFAVILFTTYVIQMDKMLEHKQFNQGLVLIYSHFWIVISLGIITVSLGFLNEEHVNKNFHLLFILSGLVIFYLSLFINSVYNKEKYKITTKDIIGYSISFLIGALIMFIGKGSNILFLLRLLVISGFILILLNKKYKSVQ